jgi:hypothetical protein
MKEKIDIPNRKETRNMVLDERTTLPFDTSKTKESIAA